METVIWFICGMCILFGNYICQEIIRSAKSV